MKNKSAYIAIGIVCVVLAAAITVQVRTMQGENSAVSQAFANSELKDSLLEWKERSDNAEADLEQSVKRLEELRQTSTENGNSSAEKQEELKTYNQLLGLTDVTGEGITMTVTDSIQTNTAIDMNNLIVHDSDLRSLVNELANAGAEAISINDERIVNTTAITCAGNVILINGNKVGSPFTIKAIGNQESLYGAITRAGGYTYGLTARSIQVDTRKSDNVQISRYTGALSFKYAQNND